MSQSRKLPDVPVDKISVAQFNQVSRTALMNLSFRAARLGPDGRARHDALAAAILARIDYVRPAYRVPEIVGLATLLRSDCLDGLVSDYVARHPATVAVSLGSGLDSRWERLRVKPKCWYDLDLPEVIAVRRGFTTESGRYRLIPGSAFDCRWLEKVKLDKGDALLILAEGLFMYFAEPRIKELIAALSARFGAFDVLLDVPDRLFYRISLWHPAFRRTQTSFRWGVNRVTRLAAWGKHVMIGGCYRYLRDNHERRRPYRYLKLVPFLNKISRLVLLQVGTEEEEGR